jgi:hypothetical protein
MKNKLKIGVIALMIMGAAMFMPISNAYTATDSDTAMITVRYDNGWMMLYIVDTDNPVTKIGNGTETFFVRDIEESITVAGGKFDDSTDALSISVHIDSGLYADAKTNRSNGMVGISLQM